MRKNVQHALVFQALAGAWYAPGEWSRAALFERSVAALARTPSWLKPLCRAVFSRFSSRESVTLGDLEAFAAESELLHAGLLESPTTVRALGEWAADVLVPPRWSVVPLHDIAALGEWLGLDPDVLAWFADARRPASNAASALQHYRTSWLPKRRGGLRLIEAPKLRLCSLQRKILREILDVVPPHPAAHGFRRGRGAHSHAAEHVGRALVVRLDLQDFFLSIHLAKVVALFVQLGYPRTVAVALGRLCTTRNGMPVPIALLGANPTPGSIHACRYAEVRARVPHLPQGAPTSPALANLSAYALDVRLAALAGTHQWRYSRYADDLVFSGDRLPRARVDGFLALVAHIVQDEGFAVNHRKTSVQTSSAQQRVGGLVVNAKAQVGRREFDALKATLRNCVLHGYRSQNRAAHSDFAAHLRGRIAWAAAAGTPRWEKLTALYRAIAWEAPQLRE
jgi:RNA-directed DNA polymerase